MDGGEFWSDGALETAEAHVICNINGTDLHHRQITEQHVSFEPTLNGVNEMVNNQEMEKTSSRSTKKRKLKSKVWDEFTKYEEVDGKEWAVCNHCKKKFVGSSKSGTTHLKNHLQRCPTKRSSPGGSSAYKSADQTGESLTTNPAVTKGKSKVDQEVNHLDETRMFIKYWAPLKSRKDDILKVFKEEKEKLRSYIEELPCRFNLLMEYFDDLKKFYVSVHFIDDNWELQKKVIYVQFEYPWSLFEKLKCMLKDWNIDKDICSIVVNDYYIVKSENYDAIEKWVSERGSLPLVGTFRSVPWLLYKIHNSLWGPKRYLKTLGKMKVLKEYVRTRKMKFEIAAENVAKSMGNKVTSQPLTTTDDEGECENEEFDFKLVEWIVGLKEVFSELEHIDDGFKPINLTKEEWDEATLLCEYREAFIDVGNSKHTTPNVYFHQICLLYIKLCHWQKTDINCFQEMVSDFRKRYFYKYWNNSNLVLAITIILDPRFKMDTVTHWYMEIYGSGANIYIEKITDKITSIYNKYAKDAKSISDDDESNCRSLHHLEDIDSTQSELDRYLKDSKDLTGEEFDILAWWHLNSSKFPTLARMARDFLSIPIGVSKTLDSSFLNEIENIIDNKALGFDIKKAIAYTKLWL